MSDIDNLRGRMFSKRFMETWIRTVLTAILVSLAAQNVSANPDPQEACQRLSDEVQQKIRPAFYEALQFPDSAAARKLPETIQALATAFMTVPDPPAVQPIVAADKHRLLAFLRLAEARLDGALAESGHAPNGEVFKQQRIELARQALSELDQAQRWLQTALDPQDPDFTPTIPALIATNKVREYIAILVVSANSILWVLEGKQEQKLEAAKIWATLPPAYIQDNSPPAPEVVKTLDLSPDVLPKSGMTTVAWAGIALLLIGLLSAIFISKASLFQQWAIRVVIAIGAAMTATVVPGLLNIKVSDWVAAGGTLAVIVLIYLFNPPKVE